MKTSKLLEARENGGDQVATVFSLHLIGLEDGASFFWTDYKVNLSESKAIPHYFRHSIESCSLWGDYMLTMFVHKVLSG